MAYDYIRRAYGVDAKVGQRVTVDGRPGMIMKPPGDPHRLHVKFDDSPFVTQAHPTWEVDYSPKEGA